MGRDNPGVGGFFSGPECRECAHHEKINKLLRDQLAIASALTPMTISMDAQLKASLDALTAERDRYEAALKEIENGNDGGWYACIAREALNQTEKKG